MRGACAVETLKADQLELKRCNCKTHLRVSTSGPQRTDPRPALGALGLVVVSVQADWDKFTHCSTSTQVRSVK